MFSYNPRTDRELGIEEKSDIELRLNQCFTESFGDLISITYRPIIRNIISGCKTSYQLKNEILKLENELEMILGKETTEGFKSKLEETIGHGLYHSVQINV